MAKSTKYATPICIGLTLLAAIGILLGLKTGRALITMFTLLPAIGYEAYRTEGVSTRWASWGLVVLFVALLIFFIFNINFDLARFFGEATRNLRGYEVPLGDIKVVGSALMIILSIILFTRTRGIYTRWLSVIIIVTSAAIVYIIAPDFFQDLIRTGTNQL